MPLKLSFYVKYEDGQSTPDVFNIFSHQPQMGGYGEEVIPNISVFILPDEAEDIVYEQFPIEFRYYHPIIGLRSREQQFMLPMIIALLEANPDWRLWNVEGCVLDAPRLKKAYEDHEINWAYLTE